WGGGVSGWRVWGWAGMGGGRRFRAATALLAAARRGHPGLGWLGSLLALAAVAHLLVVRFAPPPLPVAAVLLTHATLALPLSWLLGRWRAEPAGSLRQSALLGTAAAAVALLISVNRSSLLPLSADAAWLAALWLASSV